MKGIYSYVVERELGLKTFVKIQTGGQGFEIQGMELGKRNGFFEKMKERITKGQDQNLNYLNLPNLLQNEIL